MGGMKRFWIGTMMALALSSLARGDRLVDMRGLPYEGETLDYRGRTLHFRASNLGREITRRLDQIRSLQIEGLDAFNRAERLTEKKKFSQALKVYDEALRTVPSDRAWLHDLLTDRRYQARVRAGAIDLAMADWLAMLEADPNDAIVRTLAPNVFAPKGDPANEAALKLLEARLAELRKDPVGGEWVPRLMKIKMKLLEAMGREEQATAAAEETTRGSDAKREASAKTMEKHSGSAGSRGEAEEKQAADPSSWGGDLEVLQRLLKAGKYDVVIEQLAPRVAALPRSELAGPLFWLGKAQWLKYQADGGGDRQLLLRAGLNLMWVYSSFSDADEAPEALYLAAEIQDALQDSSAARRAREELVEQYGGAEDNPWVRKARAKLDEEGTEGKPKQN